MLPSRPFPYLFRLAPLAFSHHPAVMASSIAPPSSSDETAAISNPLPQVKEEQSLGEWINFAWTMNISCLYFLDGEEADKYRFQVELEFVQCLANPQYLNCKYIGVLCECIG